jgi:hypothetical protein
MLRASSGNAWVVMVDRTDQPTIRWEKTSVTNATYAIDQQDRNVPRGALMRCLCGDTHPRGPDGDMEWLWATCQHCWNETCVIVGLRPRQ